MRGAREDLRGGSHLSSSFSLLSAHQGLRVSENDGILKGMNRLFQRSAGLHALLWLCAALLMALAPIRPASARAEGKIQLVDVDGARHTPLDLAGMRAVVLFFIAHDCPISNGYAPEMERIRAAYAPKKIAFYVVYAEPDLAPADARQHAKEYGFRCPALLDPTHALVQKAGATVTPEAAVLGPKGKLLYRGRIDDWFMDLGKKRFQPTTHDLRAALDAIVTGKSFATRITHPVGCFIAPATTVKQGG